MVKIVFYLVQPSTGGQPATGGGQPAIGGGQPGSGRTDTGSQTGNLLCLIGHFELLTPNKSVHLNSLEN